MCSNFGFNNHPGRPPCALESHWYYLAVRAYNWLRWKLRLHTATFRYRRLP
jgi:hypothetical protein